MKKKIIHYIDSTSFGGAEQSLLNLMRELDAKKWESMLIYHSSPGINSFIQKVEELNFTTICLPRIKCWRDIRSIVSFIRKLRELHPHVFHAHLVSALRCSFGLICAYIVGIKAIVATQHSYQEPKAHRIHRLYTLKMYQNLISLLLNRYIAVSYNQAKLLEKLVPKDKITVVWNGINVKEFCNKTYSTAKFPITEEKTQKSLVLTVARMDRLKGHRYLIEAAAMVPDAVFLFAGDGIERPELENLAIELNVSDKVIFLGQRNDIPELLRTCNIFVLPSLLEGLSLSILEAMAASRPVIATDIPGMREIITDGVNGLLVPPADPDALAEKINLALSDTKLEETIALAGKKRVLRDFSSKQMAESVIRIYDEIIDRKSH